MTTIIEKQSKVHFIKGGIKMYNEYSFDDLLLEFMADEIIDYEKFDKLDVSVELKDVNKEFNGDSWESILKEYMSRYDFQLKVYYCDGNWVNIQVETI